MTEKDQSKSLKLAATVVLIRESEDNIQVLLLRRNSKLAFYGGAWVFPGGKVDPQDKLSNDSSQESIARVAACREVYEESGVEVSASQLEPLSLWIPPPSAARRYVTWFFVASMSEQKIVIDDSEIKDSKWLNPLLALKAHSNNEIELAPATYITLHWLCSFKSIPEVKSAVPREVETFRPKTLDVTGGKISLYHGDAGYESSSPLKKGGRHRLTMAGLPYEYERHE